MKFLFGISFILIVVAILIIFKIDVTTINKTLSSLKQNKSLKKLAQQDNKKSKIGVFYKNILIALTAMGQMNNLYYIFLFSFLLIILGVFSGITFGNVYLAIVLGIALSLLPFIYVRMQYIEYKTLILDEMETGLSVITSSIERSENIEESFIENIENINKPLQTVFRQFLYAIQHNVPMDVAIDEMKDKINQSVFIDWCDNLKRCSKDRSLKTSLRPIVDRITDIKIASAEAKNILFEASGEFRAVSLISVVFMILTYWVLPAAFNSFGLNFDASFTDILMAIDIFMLFFFSLRTFLLTKDINF